VWQPATAVTSVSLPAVLLAGYKWCCLAMSKSEGAEGHAKPLRLQHLDCHWGEVLTESRPRLHVQLSTMSVTVSGCAGRSPMRLGLADDSCEIGRSIGALVPCGVWCVVYTVLCGRVCWCFTVVQTRYWTCSGAVVSRSSPSLCLSSATIFIAAILQIIKGDPLWVSVLC